MLNPHSAIVHQGYTLPLFSILAALVFLSVHISSGKWKESAVLDVGENMSGDNQEGLLGGEGQFTFSPTTAPASDFSFVPVPTAAVVAHQVPEIQDTPDDGSSPVHLKWNIPLGQPTPDPVLLADPATPPSLVFVDIRKDVPIARPPHLLAPDGSPVNLDWNIPDGEPTPDPALLLDPNTPPELIRKDTPISLSWNIPLGLPTPDPALLTDPATAPQLINEGTPISLSWNIPRGEPTPDPALLYDPATSPVLVTPANGSPINLSWNIPLGEPTPDPAMLTDPATSPHLIKAGTPISLQWDIPYGEPTPDPAQLNKDGTPILVKWNIPLGEPTPDPALLTKEGTPVNIAWNIPLGEPTPDPALLDKHGTPINIKWQIPLGEPTPDPIHLDKQGTPVHIGWNIPLGQPTPDPALHDKNGTPINLVWGIPQGEPTPDPAKLTASPSTTEGGTPIVLKWDIPKGAPTPDPALLNKDETPVQLIWGIPKGEPTPDPIYLLPNNEPSNIPPILKRNDGPVPRPPPKEEAPTEPTPGALAWNPEIIPLGSPTPDPAFLNPSNSIPVELKWNIPEGWPTPDPVKLFPAAGTPAVSSYLPPVRERFPTVYPTPATRPLEYGTDTPTVGASKRFDTPPPRPPSAAPTNPGEAEPTEGPSPQPTVELTESPTVPAFEFGTLEPSLRTPEPSEATPFPTGSPSDKPTSTPTGSPTLGPSPAPTDAPVLLQTGTPTESPSNSPTQFPTVAPVLQQTETPTRLPTEAPTRRPTPPPTFQETASPSRFPTPPPTPAAPPTGIRKDGPVPRPPTNAPPVPFQQTPAPVIPVPPPTLQPTPQVVVHPVGPPTVVVVPVPQLVPIVQPVPQPTSVRVVVPQPPVGVVPGPQVVVIPGTIPQVVVQPETPVSNVKWEPGPIWWTPTQPAPTVKPTEPPVIVHNQKFLQGCDPHQCVLNEGAEFHAMSHEDESIYEIFYTNPIKCCRVIVEIGAGDGERYSVSKYFEDALNWRSLLIEAHPDQYGMIATKRPNAASVFGGFCESSNMIFNDGSFSCNGGSVEIASEVQSPIKVGDPHNHEVPCLQMDAVFSEHGITKVDVMVVRLQGDTLAFIRAMDWTVRVDIWVVLMHGATTAERDDLVRTVLEKNDYVQAEWDIRRWCDENGLCLNNEVFLRKGFNPLPCDLKQTLSQINSAQRRLRGDPKRRRQ